MADEIQDTPHSGDAAILELAKPKRPTRKAWKEKEAAGKTRTGTELPKVASKKEAKAYMQELAKEALETVVAGKELPVAYKEKFEKMSFGVKAKIMSMLGDDIDAARATFAQELLADARAVKDVIMEEFHDYPPHVKTFWFTALVDKGEALRQKSAAAASVANVNTQITIYGDGVVDKAALINQLSGAAFGLQPERAAVPVQPVVEVPAVTVTNQ